MKVKTNVKAGGRKLCNHNEILVRETAKAKGVKVKTNVKGGVVIAIIAVLVG